MLADKVKDSLPYQEVSCIPASNKGLTDAILVSLVM